MDRKGVLGFCAGVIATCIAVWSLHPAPQKLRTLQPAQVASHPAPISHRVVPPTRPRASDADADAPPDDTGGSFEQVVRKIAEYSGDGVVRCEVGDQLPDGPLEGLGHAWVEDGLLVGSVEDPQGSARVRLPDDAMSDPPRAVVKWADAWPGETGTCVVTAPKHVLVSGRVVDPSGRPVDGVEVGNLVDGTTPAAPGGRFTVLCWQGVECPLAARRAVGQPFGSFVTLVPERPVNDVVVVMDQPQEENLQDFLQERVAEDEQLEKQPDPLVLALADPSLPAETRPVVEGWLQEERDGRNAARALLADIGGDQRPSSR